MCFEFLTKSGVHLFVFTSCIKDFEFFGTPFRNSQRIDYFFETRCGIGKEFFTLQNGELFNGIMLQPLFKLVGVLTASDIRKVLVFVAGIGRVAFQTCFMSFNA